MSDAVHVSFLMPRALIEGAVNAMDRYAESRDERFLVRVLGEAWSLQQDWRSASLTGLDAQERRRVGRWLGDDRELVDALASVPAQVREAALGDVRRHSSVLARLRQMAAPKVVKDRLRESLALSIACLDPAAAMPEVDTPGLCYIGDEAGNTTVNVHDWLEQLLRAAKSSGRSGLTSDRMQDADPCEASAPEASRDGYWPGLELTSFGMEPELPMWRHPRLTLPRPLATGGTAVVGVDGGPATYAVAGDVPASAVSAALAARVRALTRDDALVSFLSLEGKVAAVWGVE